MPTSMVVVPESQVRELLRSGGPAAVAAEFRTLHAVEVGETLEQLNYDERQAIVQVLPHHVAARVLLHADAEFRNHLLNNLAPELLARLLTRLPVEHAAQLLEQMNTDHREAVRAALEPEIVAQMDAVHRSPRHSVGRLMVRKVPHLHPEMTVAETLAYLRTEAAELETINNLYVLDDQHHLIGVVALRQLVEAAPEQRIADLMHSRVVTVKPDSDREVASDLISRYNFLALPVVDDEQRLKGIVTVDDLIDVLTQEQTEDVLHMAGIAAGDDVGTETSYWAGEIWGIVRRRLGWLLLLFVAETFTGSVLRHFDHEISKVTALAFFIPLLIGTGGNAGSQTVTTIVRGLAVGEIRMRDASRVFVRECATGILLGLSLGLIGFGRALLWGQDWRLCATVGAALVAICIWANTIGSMVPLLARRLRIDPTIVSAPMITTVVDATGLVIYFLIAKAMLDI